MLRTFAIAALLVFACVPAAYAQCPVPLDTDAPPMAATALNDIVQAPDDEQLLPESGYISNTSYTSVYFGFALDLPLSLEGHRLMLPLTLPGQHALLSLAYQDGSRHGSFTITASPPANRTAQMTDAQKQEAFQRWARGEPQLQRSPPDWMMRTGHFYHVEKHVGEERGVSYWTRIKNYTLRITAISNDQQFVKKAKSAIEAIRMYCPGEDGTLTTAQGDVVTPDGAPYQGPTIPTAHVDSRLSERPEEHAIPAGEVNGGSYYNVDLGLEYVIPKGWTVYDALPNARDATLPATAIAQRTSDFLRACSRTLLQMVKDVPGSTPKTGVANRITVRALDPTCLSLRGPDDVNDRPGAEELGAYLEMLGDFGEIELVDLVPLSGHLFAVYRGTVGDHSDGQPLATRASQAIVVTRYRKMLLLWTFVAPKGTNLSDMPQTRAIFDQQDTVEWGPSLFGKR